eukprot:tig00000852_g5014.t2
MGKSMRSKIKRKWRAVKAEKLAPKEVERVAKLHDALKERLAKEEEERAQEQMADAEPAAAAAAATAADGSMEVDAGASGVKKTISKKALKNKKKQTKKRGGFCGSQGIVIKKKKGKSLVW